MNYKKPTDEDFKDIMDSFWIMLKECETKAHNDNDRVLKKWVEGFYRQWNHNTGQNHKPAWE